MIKILYLIDELMAGGTENQLLLLSDGLSRDIFEPVIGILHPNEYSLNLKLRTPIINFGKAGLSIFNKIFLVNTIRDFIEREEINIIQTHFTDSSIVGTLAANLCRPKPIVIGTRRNLYHWINDEPINFQVYRFTSRWSDRIIVNSMILLAKCREVENIDNDKLIFIPNGVDIQRFEDIPSAGIKQKLGFDSSPLIGVVANWRPIKGLTTFIRAAALVHKKNKSCHFVLAGQGPQKTELMALCRDIGLEEHVTFIENPSNVAEIITAFDVAVQPSNSESFSNVLIEYMAAGSAIVATRVGDAENIIEDQKDGILVAPGNPEEMGNAILSILSNQKKADEMKKMAKEKVIANWGLKTIIERYQQLYIELFQQKKR